MARILVWQWSQQDRIEDAEDRRVRTNAERQGEDCDCAMAWPVQQASNSVAKVFEKYFHDFSCKPLSRCSSCAVLTLNRRSSDFQSEFRGFLSVLPPATIKSEHSQTEVWTTRIAAPPADRLSSRAARGYNTPTVLRLPAPRRPPQTLRNRLD